MQGERVLAIERQSATEIRQGALRLHDDTCEAYILSQKHEGWVCLPGMYDDGGISGATMERPALRRLLEDIEAGRIKKLVNETRIAIAWDEQRSLLRAG